MGPIWPLSSNIVLTKDPMDEMFKNYLRLICLANWGQAVKGNGALGWYSFEIIFIYSMFIVTADISDV